MKKILVLCLALALMQSGRSFAAESATMEREMLYFEDIPVVSAAKYAQPVSEAPSYVTIITDDQIEKFGYRTLGDALDSVAGLYMVNDRYYNYAGVRGFLRSEDYNTRLLVMIDGHSINEDVYGGAYFDEWSPIDISLVKRIEVVRGPGSALYGSNAFFAVINVITKNADEIKGINTSIAGGSFNTNKETFSYGGSSDDGIKTVVAGSIYNSEGNKKLIFDREDFIAPPAKDVVSENCDYKDAYNTFVKLEKGDYSFSAAASHRLKGIPTGAYLTILNDPESRTEDWRRYLELKYRTRLDSATNLNMRAYFDQYDYVGDYNIDYPPVTLNKDIAMSSSYGSEVSLDLALTDNNRLLLGGEYQDHTNNRLINYDDDPNYFEYLDDSDPRSNSSLYVQDEIKFDGSALTLGLRNDFYTGTTAQLNPRLAYIINPYEAGTLKFLYGRAFRTPSMYEKIYILAGTYKGNEDLRPEVIYNYEMAYEHRLDRTLTCSISMYKYDIHDLIDQIMDPSDGLLVFQNISRVDASGVELTARKEFGPSFYGFLAYANQRAMDASNGSALSNSPENNARAGIVFPVINDKTTLSTQLKHVGSMKTNMNEFTYPYLLADMSLLAKDVFELSAISVSIYNLFDTKYTVPGSPAGVLDKIQQDGRSFTIKVTKEF